MLTKFTTSAIAFLAYSMLMHLINVIVLFWFQVSNRYVSRTRNSPVGKVSLAYRNPRIINGNSFCIFYVFWLGN